MTRKGNIGVKVLMKHENKVIGTRVELTKKTKLDGQVIYAVVITNMNTGWHYRIFTFNRIMDAHNQYKAALA